MLFVGGMNTIGIDVGGTNLRSGLVDSNGQIIELKKVSTPQGSTNNAQSVLNQLAQMITELQGLSTEPILGIGLGWPGPVDRKSGVIHLSPNLAGFDNFPISQKLSEMTSLKCLVDNDAKCAGLGEWRFGAAKNLNNFVVMTFGTGIGGVVFSEGNLVYGKTGGAGEIGHMT